jgi:1,4-dihydroxy-2-naphthoyl-CoA hydrolase
MLETHPPMPFCHTRTVHFADTDAAGVVYFANTISICHEAYEEALAAAGINLNAFFSARGVLIPISKAESEYLRPLACGDKLSITVTPRSLTPDSFEVRYEVTRLGTPPKCAARIRTEHVCTDPKKRARTALPDDIARWVAAG